MSRARVARFLALLAVGALVAGASAALFALVAHREAERELDEAAYALRYLVALQLEAAERDGGAELRATEPRATSPGAPAAASTTAALLAWLRPLGEAPGGHLRFTVEARAEAVGAVPGERALGVVREPDGARRHLVLVPAARPLPVPWAVVVAGMGAVALLAWLLSALGDDTGRRPLAAIRAAAERARGGDLSVRVGGTYAGEAARAASTFDGMLAELERTRTALRRAERRAAWRDMAQRMAHEIKNPLSPIQMSVENLARAHARDPAAFPALMETATRTVREEVERIRRILDEFRDFARMPPPRPVPADLSAAVRHVVELVAPAHRPGALTVEAPATLPLRADDGQLVQVVLNLVKNALDAAEAHRGQERARVVVTAAAAGPHRVTLAVEDNGPGVPAAEREAIFEPHVSSKAHGAGLGLAIVARIVEEHRGEVSVGDATGGGARFVVTLPVDGPPPAADSTAGA